MTMAMLSRSHAKDDCGDDREDANDALHLGKLVNRSQIARGML